MTHTVVGVFDSDTEARAVQDELIGMGIPQGNVMIHGGSGQVDRARTEPHHEGGIMGFFRSLFGMDNDEHSGRYSEAVRRGSHVVTVQASDEAQVQRIEGLMQDHHAIDVDEREEHWRKEGWQGYDASAPTFGADDIERERSRDADTSSRRIPVVDEELRVGKRTVERGGVRVFARTTERPVEEQVTLREEHARVQRTPVDRAATADDLRAASAGDTIEVRETTEEPVVEKIARVVEEVEVGREVSERTETIRDSVKHTEIGTEALQGSRAPGTAARTNKSTTTSRSKDTAKTR